MKREYTTHELKHLIIILMQINMRQLCRESDIAKQKQAIELISGNLDWHLKELIVVARQEHVSETTNQTLEQAIEEHWDEVMGDEPKPKRHDCKIIKISDAQRQRKAMET